MDIANNIKQFLKTTPFYKLYTWYRYERWQPVIGNKDTVLKRFFDNNQPLSLLQVGAYDGITCDPVLLLMGNKALSGILVEPQASACQRLRNHYSGSPNIHIVHAAIDSKDGEAIMYKPEGAEDSVLNSFSKEHVLKHLNPGEKVVEEKVQTRSLSSLLQEYHIKNIDLLITDTEGFDYQILKQFPFDVLKPRVIIYESVHLDIGTYKKSVELLRKHGYVLEKDGWDTVAFIG